MSKSIRRLLCIVLILVLMLSMNVWTAVASAEESAVQPRWSYTNSTITSLNISTGGTSTCSASASGYSNITTKIKIKLRLQQYLAAQWTTIAVWESTFSDYYGVLSKTKALTSTGNYRVEAVYTVYSGSASETITMHSQEKYFIKK